jgi:hypothetical protein
MTSIQTTSMMFDPVRITRLHLQTSQAVEALGRISASDPSADHAIACCRQMSLTLNEMWLPMLREVMELHSFSHYETVLRTDAQPSYSHYSDRFGSRSAGRVRAIEMRRERARRAAEISCIAPWLASRGIRQSLGHLTTWTWADFNDALAQLKKAVSERQDPKPHVQRLMQYQRAITSDVLSDSQAALREQGSRESEHSEVSTALKGLVENLPWMIGLTTPTWVERSLAPEQFEELRYTSGENFAIVLNLYLLEVDENEPASKLLIGVATNPVLLALLEPHLHLLDNKSIALLATTVLDYDSPVLSPRHLNTPHGVNAASAPILREILNREGGHGALSASPAATSALIGTWLAPTPGCAAAIRAALDAGSARLQSGHSAEHIERERKVERLELLATFSDILGNQKLKPSVSRYLALTFAPILNDLAPHLDREHLVVTPRSADPSDLSTVLLGPRSRVAAAFGRIMNDEYSQLILGVAAGQIVSERPDSAAQYLLSTDRDIDAVRYIQAQLTLGQQALNFLADSRDAQNEHLTFEHGMSVARTKNVINLLTIPVSFGPIHLNAVSNLAAPALLSALGMDTPPKVPSFGLDSDLAILHTATALRVPIDYPELRERLGVDDVPTKVWKEFADLLERLEESSTPEMRTVVMSQITAHAQNDPSIHGYINAMRIGSGAL